MSQQRFSAASRTQTSRAGAHSNGQARRPTRPPRPGGRASAPGGDGPIAYDVPEVMRRLGITRPTVYRFLRSGELRSFRLGSRRLVSAAALEDFICERESEEAG